MLRIWDKSKPPPGPFALNRDAPQAQGLAAWWPHGGPTSAKYIPDLAGRFHLTGTGTGPSLGESGQPFTTHTTSTGETVTATTSAAFPVSLCAWVRPATTAFGQSILGFTDSSGTHRVLLFAGSDAKIKGYSQDAGGGEFKGSTSTSYVANAWQHTAAVYASSTDNRVFLNGGGKGTSATSRGWGANIDRMRIAGDNSGGNWFFGDIGEAGIWTVALDDSLIWRLYDPGTRYELWYPLRSRKWMVATGGNVTVALSGQAVTASAGTLIPSSTVAASGQAVTASAGTVAPSTSLAASGQAVAASAGTLTPSMSVTAAGQAVTASAGTLTPSATVALSGQAVTVSAGTLTYSAGSNITLTLAGQAVTVSAGTLGVASAKALTGQVVAASAGTLVPGRSISISGSQVTVSAGTLTVSRTTTLLGQVVAASAGTLTYNISGSNITLTLTGQAVIVSAGTLTFSGAAAVYLDTFAARSRITKILPLLSRITTRVGLRSPLSN